jgi:hypothetical protein
VHTVLGEHAQFGRAICDADVTLLQALDGQYVTLGSTFREYHRDVLGRVSDDEFTRVGR